MKEKTEILIKSLNAATYSTRQIEPNSKVNVTPFHDAYHSLVETEQFHFVCLSFRLFRMRCFFSLALSPLFSPKLRKIEMFASYLLI